MEVENSLGNSPAFIQDSSQKRTAGFGSAGSEMDRGIDLNDQLIMNKSATIFMRVSGNSMEDAGIQNDDIVIVDRSIKPANGKIVIAILDGELLIRRYEQTFNKLRLVPETRNLAAIEVGEFSNCQVWGVVTSLIRMIDKNLAHFNETGQQHGRRFR